jgi:hypothetical protein
LQICFVDVDAVADFTFRDLTISLKFSGENLILGEKKVRKHTLPCQYFLNFIIVIPTYLLLGCFDLVIIHDFFTEQKQLRKLFDLQEQLRQHLTAANSGRNGSQHATADVIPETAFVMSRKSCDDLCRFKGRWKQIQEYF